MVYSSLLFGYHVAPCRDEGLTAGDRGNREFVGATPSAESDVERTKTGGLTAMSFIWFAGSKEDVGILGGKEVLVKGVVLDEVTLEVIEVDEFLRLPDMDYAIFLGDDVEVSDGPLGKRMDAALALGDTRPPVSEVDGRTLAEETVGIPGVSEEGLLFGVETLEAVTLHKALGLDSLTGGEVALWSFLPS